MTTPSEVLNKCSKCGAEKPLDAYYKRTNGRLHTECKSCYIARVGERSRRRDVRDRDNAALRARRRKTRDQVFAAYGGYRCVCCGESEPKFLTLDHINNDGGQFRAEMLGKRTMAGYHTYRWLLKNGCPPTVQVMCMNCQHGKAQNGGICPHQKTCNDYPAREYGQAAGSATPLKSG